MKIGKKFVSLALAGMLLMAGCGSGSGATYATVNGDKIPKAKYESQLDLYKSMIAAQYRLCLLYTSDAADDLLTV